MKPPTIEHDIRLYIRVRNMTELLMHNPPLAFKILFLTNQASE